MHSLTCRGCGAVLDVCRLDGCQRTGAHAFGYCWFCREEIEMLRFELGDAIAERERDRE